MRVPLAWLPAGIYMVLIWMVSSFPIPKEDIFGDHIPFKDKGIHAVEFCVLAVLWMHASLRTWPARSPLRHAMATGWVVLHWGLLDEMHQALVPGRNSEWLDLLADGVGATAGVLFYGTLLRLSLRKKSIVATHETVHNP